MILNIYGIFPIEYMCRRISMYYNKCADIVPIFLE